MVEIKAHRTRRIGGDSESCATHGSAAKTRLGVAQSCDGLLGVILRIALERATPVTVRLPPRLDRCHASIAQAVCASARGLRLAPTASRAFGALQAPGTAPRDLPLRQLVITFPIALRYRIGFDPKLCAAVRKVILRAIMGFYQGGVRRKRLATGFGGAVVVTQRFGSALNLSVHFQILAFDGVFLQSEDPDQRPKFWFRGNPSDHAIEQLLATCRQRVLRLLERRDVPLGAETLDEPAHEDLTRITAPIRTA